MDRLENLIDVMQRVIDRKSPFDMSLWIEDESDTYNRGTSACMDSLPSEEILVCLQELKAARELRDAMIGLGVDGNIERYADAITVYDAARKNSGDVV